MNTRQDSKRKAADRAKGTTGGQIGRELVRCFGPIAPPPLAFMLVDAARKSTVWSCVLCADRQSCLFDV